MNFYQFDPRPQGVVANEKILSENPDMLGVEVTEPVWAARCSRGNIDHHSAADTAETPSACEQALKQAFACENETNLWPSAMATIRPDADSITAMAVMKNAQEGRPTDEELVHSVGRMDRYGPSAGKPDVRVSAIARKAFDFKLPLADRVAWVADLFAGVDKSAEIAALVAANDAELEAAQRVTGLTLRADGRIAVVVSTSRNATTLGYEKAQVVIALNPSLLVDPRDSSKGTYVKFTVCRYDSHVKCDLPAALKELQALESGWGGRGDIFGSPQGVSSVLTLDQVVGVVSRHLK